MELAIVVLVGCAVAGAERLLRRRRIRRLERQLRDARADVAREERRLAEAAQGRAVRPVHQRRAGDRR